MGLNPENNDIVSTSSIGKVSARALFMLAGLMVATVNAYAFELEDAPQEIGEAMEPPPVRKALTSMEIDAISGAPAGFGGMRVSVGTDQSGIARNPGRQRYMHDNFTGTLSEIIWNGSNDGLSELMQDLPADTYFKVDALGRSELFHLSGGEYVTSKDTHGSLSCSGDICTYTTPTGTVSTLDKTLSNGFRQGALSSPYYKNIALQTKIVRPDGEEITLTYQRVTDYLADIPSAAVSSLGWMIKYQFGPKTSEDVSGDGYAGTRTSSSRSVQAINTSVEYCDPEAADCDGMSNTWPESIMDAEQTITWPTGTRSSSGFQVGTSSIVTNALGESDSHWKTQHTSGGVETGEGYTSPGGISYWYHIGAQQYDYSFGYNIDMPWTDRVRSAVVRGRQESYNHSEYAEFPSVDGTFEINIDMRRLSRFTDNLGRVNKYTYTDQWGNHVDKLIDPDATPDVDNATGGYTDYDYDSRGNITDIKVEPKNGGAALVKSATYPSSCSNPKTCNKPTSVTDQAGVTTEYTYHAPSGKIASITKPAVDGVQAQVRFTYEQQTPRVRNSSGNLVDSTPVWRLTEVSKCMTMTLDTCVGTADEKRITIEYDHNNVLPTSKTVMRGDGSLAQTTTYDYDIYGNLKWKDGPRPGSHDRVYYFYDAVRQKVAEIGVDPDGPGPLPRQATHTEYNADGQVTSVKKGTVSATTLSAVLSMNADIEKTTEYDDTTGLPVIERVYADGVQKKVTQKSYDDRWNLECEAERLNPAYFDNLPASACDLGPTGPDGPDRITRYSYDATDKLVATTQAYGTARQRVERTNHYRADNGLLEAVEDGKGNKTFYQYDDYKRLEKTIYPDPNNGAVASATDYTQKFFDGAQVEKKRLRDGQIVNYFYDERGRVESQTGAISETFEYDNFGQIVSHTNHTTGGASATSTFQFNSLGWQESETTAHGTVSYQHDNYGRRTRLTWPDGFYVTYDYQVSGYPGDRLRQIKEYGSTVLATYDYDEFGRRDTLTRGNGVVTDYEYDDLSRLDTLATDVGGGDSNDITESFEYTVAGQLKSRSLTANDSYRYAPTPGQNYSYGINALNQITDENGAAFGYDDRGNLTSEGNNSYTYNANNLLTSATRSGETTDLTYDAENRLYSITHSGATTRFMYDGQDMIAETDTGGNVVNRYVHGPGVDDPIVWYEGSGTGDKLYYHKNHQDSIVGITHDDGDSHAINAYDEYGNPAPENLGRFQYTGQTWLKEINLYYYKARLYNPHLGRFMQVDPVGYEDQINLYTYVGNDPLNYTDPSGGKKKGGFLEWLFGKTKEKAKEKAREKTKEKLREIAEDQGLSPMEICHIENCLDAGPYRKSPCLIKNCYDKLPELNTPNRREEGDPDVPEDGNKPEEQDNGQLPQDVVDRIRQHRESGNDQPPQPEEPEDPDNNESRKCKYFENCETKERW